MTRREKDSFGSMDLPHDALYGAQTARSLENFPIGSERMPLPLLHALILIKQAAAKLHGEQGRLEAVKSQCIIAACEELLDSLDSIAEKQFPLKIWQTGSGTQSHMNVNEVIANLSSQKRGGKIGDHSIHPNDDVNKSQSSNDVFPTAMHIAALNCLHSSLFPSLQELIEAFENKASEHASTLKVGRTHLMDAAPISLGQEFSAYCAQLGYAKKALKESCEELSELAIGATAVGTGLNSPKNFGEEMAKELSKLSGFPLTKAPNPFAALAGHEAFVKASSALKMLATSLLKISNDIRLLASGPRSGLAELKLPANEPGSSIMPGKVNPTQCEALCMVCCQVIGNDASLSLAASLGNFQLNTYKPLIFYNLYQSIQLLSDSMKSFSKRCIEGLEVNKEVLEEKLSRNLMLATALNHSIGYDKASLVVKKAQEENLSIKEAALLLKLLTDKELDDILDPRKMI